MAIVSTTEIKSYLDLSTITDYDALISVFIPICLHDFFDYTNNYFHNYGVRVNSASVTASSSDQTIILGDTNFSTWSFLSGDDIHVVNSARNDGFYIAGSVSSATVTLTQSSDNIATDIIRNEEEQEATWSIYKMDFPAAAKPTIAQMVKFRIDYPQGIPQNENVGDYSVNYGSLGSGYPIGIVSQMRKYKLVKFV